MRERNIPELLYDLAEAERLHAEADRLAAEARVGLRRAREAAGMTQSDVAAAMGVTKAYVSQVENGRGATSGSLRSLAQSIEGGTHAPKVHRRRAREDLKKARRQAQDD